MSDTMAVMGGHTDHGGKIITGNPLYLIEGRPTACLGDLVYCPKCKGVYKIITGNTLMVIDDKPVATAGCKTACGATILPHQTLAFIERQGWGSSGSQSKNNSPEHKEKKLFDDKFQILDNEENPLIGVKYALVKSDGTYIEGITDQDGMTERLTPTDQAESVEIYILSDDA